MAPRPRTTRPSGTSITALNSRAYGLLRRGRYAEAEPLLRQALRANPNYAYALYNLGWSLVGQGKGREAIEPLRESAALQPGRWEPQQRLSEAYEQIGNSVLAFEARARARELRGSRRRALAIPGRQKVDRPGPRVAVRMQIGETAWVGSTDRREAEYLRARQEWRAEQQTIPDPTSDPK
jgi:tetratricopeptide (TPR) repeat protein